MIILCCKTCLACLVSKSHNPLTFGLTATKIHDIARELKRVSSYGAIRLAKVSALRDSPANVLNRPYNEIIIVSHFYSEREDLRKEKTTLAQ